MKQFLHCAILIFSSRTIDYYQNLEKLPSEANF